MKFEEQITHYLDNVIIYPDASPPSNERNKQILIDYLHSHISTCQHDIINQVSQLVECTARTDREQDNWIQCKATCFETLKNCMMNEITSTAFYLRIFVNSILISEVYGTNCQIVLKIIALDTLTGFWNHDKHYLSINKIVITNLDTNQQFEDLPISFRPAKLIVGAGPSASGKTYMAKQMISILSQIYPTYPKCFVSIDGGIYRESSIIYQLIIQALHNNCQNPHVIGIDNLATPNFIEKKFGHVIFDSDVVKNELKTYLHELKTKNEIYTNLYVPETLSGCNISMLHIKPCNQLVQEYVDLSGDQQWIAILIWQHLKKCSYDDPLYKCNGAEASGKRREKTEGKPYSSSQYEKSMHEGILMMQQAPGGRYKIHNCANNTGISVIEDYTPASVIPLELQAQYNETFLHLPNFQYNNMAQPLYVLGGRRGTRKQKPNNLNQKNLKPKNLKPKKKKTKKNCR